MSNTVFPRSVHCATRWWRSERQTPVFRLVQDQFRRLQTVHHRRHRDAPARRRTRPAVGPGDRRRTSALTPASVAKELSVMPQ